MSYKFAGLIIVILSLFFIKIAHETSFAFSAEKQHKSNLYRVEEIGPDEIPREVK